MPRDLPYEISPDEVRIARTKTSDPHVQEVYQATLKDGPQAYRFAYIFKIVNPKTGELHHYSLRIDNWKRTKRRGWEEQPERSVTLEQDEFEKLVDFIPSIVAGSLIGDDQDYIVVRGHEFTKVKDLIRILPKLETEAKLEFIREVLQGVASDAVDPSTLLRSLGKNDRSILHEIAAAANLVTYREAFKELESLIEDSDAGENQFQRLLEDNPWMFGSEYSELLERRTWTRDEQQDFMLRRTVDGYLEIAEIKTPDVDPLFNWDSSHRAFYPSAGLAKVVGQTIKYLEQVDRNRDGIVAHDDVDVLKIRARVIIGRDKDEAQKAALRNLNSHLHRVEVITFDQLSRIARRVLDVFEDGVQPESSPFEEDDDLPF